MVGRERKRELENTTGSSTFAMPMISLRNFLVTQTQSLAILFSILMSLVTIDNTNDSIPKAVDLPRRSSVGVEVGVTQVAVAVAALVWALMVV